MRTPEESEQCLDSYPGKLYELIGLPYCMKSYPRCGDNLVQAAKSTQLTESSLSRYKVAMDQLSHSI